MGNWLSADFLFSFVHNFKLKLRNMQQCMHSIPACFPAWFAYHHSIWCRICHIESHPLYALKISAPDCTYKKDEKCATKLQFREPSKTPYILYATKIILTMLCELGIAIHLAIFAFSNRQWQKMMPYSCLVGAHHSMKMHTEISLLWMRGSTICMSANCTTNLLHHMYTGISKETAYPKFQTRSLQ